MFAVSLNGSRALTSDEVQDLATPLAGAGLSVFPLLKNGVLCAALAASHSTEEDRGKERTPLGLPYPLMARDLIVAGRLEVDAQWQ